MATRTIGELAQVVRSKQAGPYRLTLDIVFDDPAVYQRVRRTGVIRPELVARLYGVPREQITRFVEFEPGQAFKITMKRRVPAGDPGDSDVYGACQSAPLLDVEIPWDEDR